MNPGNSLFNIIIPEFLSTRFRSRKFALLFILLLVHAFVYAQNPRQRFLEQRKAAIINKTNPLFQTNTKINSRVLRPNQTLCDFTLDSVHVANNPLSQIIQSLAGSGITISNIQTNLPASSSMYGSFSCGSAAKLGLDSGLVLTSGSIFSAKGPNSESGKTGGNLPLPGYSLLDDIADDAGFDAVWVSFDIVSITDSIKFDYVFASEEYKEFVFSDFNDVFGFFISGPGITGTQNLAVLPNSTTPVTINSINPLVNGQYYIDNDFNDYVSPGNPATIDATRFANFEFDGLTTVLTARARVIPGQTYHLILAIEDVADEILDSGVFLKEGSVTSGVCPMNLSATHTDLPCPAANNGSINLTITNGKAPFNIKWSNNATTEDLNNLAAGTYTVTVTDASPCQKKLEVTVSAGTSTFIPSVSIAASATGAICPGTNVTFTATPTNGGTAPLYQWKRNGNNVGTNINTNTYQNAALVDGDKITCVMTSGLACANPKTATSNQIIISVTAVVPSVSIAANPAANPAAPICAGTNVTFTATPTNGGTAPLYQWKRNGTIVGTNSNTYQNAALVNGDKITCVMTSSLDCANPKTATSNQITMSVTAAVAPSVSIAANPAAPICPGTNVTFTATPTNGGTAPLYQWKRNGNNVGTNTTNNTYQNAALVTGDKITCVMTSTLACANPKTATSNQITMSVTAVAPSVNIAAIPAGAICPGINVTFTATPTNGGTAPLYQWKRNGNNVGTNSNTNTYQNAALVNGDKITCVMTSVLLCANPKTDTSNQIIVSVSSPPLATIIPTGSLSFCLGKSVLLSANTGAGYTYQWKKGGVSIAQAIQPTYTATIAGVYTVVVTTAAKCSTTSAATTVVVNPLPIALVTPGGTVTFCTGKNVLLKANAGAGYKYQWKKAGVNIIGDTLANYTATLSGVYTVVVTTAAGCSTTSAATTVVVNPLPIALVTPGGTVTFCTGKNVLLKANAGAGYKYQWKKAGVNIIGDTLANYTATLSGVYTVVVTTAAGCSTTSAATTVVVNPLPIALVTPGGTVTFCTGKNVLLKANAGAGYKYQWKKAGVNIIGDTLANYTATLSGVYTVVVTTAAGCSTTSAATTVVVNPLPIALVTPGGTVTFCTGKNVLLKANAGAGYKYQWKKAGVNIIGDTLANYTATLSGVYTVVVTTAAGCSTTSAATTVVVNPLPIALVTPGGTVTFCTGKNVLLKANAGAGYKYQWKKAGVNIIGDTLANYTATLSGVYTVVVTTAAGCSTTSAATTVVVNPLPIALVTPGGTVTFCTGKNVLLKANAGAGYKYQWKKAGVNIIGDTLANYTATLSGVYTVVVTTAAGCSTTSAATTVVVNPLPIALVTPGGTVTFCTGKNVLLKANAGAGYKYQWKKAGVNIIGDTLANYTATLSGVYTVVVTTAAGCSTTSAATTVVVNPLPIALVTPGGTVTFCTGKNVLLKANAGAGYKYQWKKAGVNIIGDTLANYTATLSGVYTVVVTTAAGCSTTSAATTVVVNPLPIALVTPGGTVTFCTGKNVLLKANAGAGYKYQWKKAGVNIIGDTLANYTATLSGVYTVVVTTAAGCSTTSAATTVVVNPLPIALVTPGGTVTFCTGKNVLLKANAGAGYKYQWKKAGVNIIGDTLANYTATVSGVYTVVVTTAAGCSTTSAATTVVVNPLPIATITPAGPLTITVGGNVLLNASAGVGNAYQWKKDGVTIIGAFSNTYAATVAGVYTVIITNSNSCQATSQPVQVSVTPAPAITKGGSSFRQAEINQMNPEPVIKIFPNPLHGDEYLNFEWNISNADKNIQVTVFDISGRRIESRFLNSSGKKLKIKGVSGIYMVEIRWGKNERKIFQIIKI